jgi:hypothetical protein
MKVPEHPNLIQNGTISLNETDHPILALEIVPGRFTDPLKTKFNWTFVDFKPYELLIQLNFEHISYISSTNGNPDSMKMTIYGIQYFSDSLGNLMYLPTILPSRSLPTMALKE